MTEIKGALSDRTLEVWRNGRGALGPLVGVKVTGAPPDGGINVTRAEFLAAIEAELNVIVIERADLPEPMVAFGEVKSGHVHAVLTASPEWHENTAKHHLAISEYLRENPPVDEAQVRALADLIFEAHPSPQLGNEIARLLVSRGVRIGGAS